MIQIRDFSLIRAHVLVRPWCTDFVILTSITFTDISYCRWYIVTKLQVITAVCLKTWFFWAMATRQLLICW